MRDQKKDEKHKTGNWNKNIEDKQAKERIKIKESNKKYKTKRSDLN